MMTLWTSKDVAKALDAKTGDWAASGISIDTRTLKKGDLFFALKGPHADGHDYVLQALEKGAVAAVVERIPEGADMVRCVLVPDTLEALEDLGRFGRARTQAKIIAVTGSVGKTGTKDMLETVFKDQCRTHASQKSYNNHWGVPLTLALMPEDTEVGIFEVGMNHAGEISPLSKMIHPDIAIITTVEAVHIESFENGEEGVADAKAEIFDGLNGSGQVLLNRNNKWFDYLSEKSKNSVISFSLDNSSDAYLQDALISPDRTDFHARILGQTIPVHLSVSGEHHALNSLPVLLSVKLLGYDLEQAAASLAGWTQRDGRGKIDIINMKEGQAPIYLIDEHYNASPVAMRAAFAAMARLRGRKIAVLGDMAELGEKAPDYHRELVPDLLAAGVDLVFAAGPNMTYLFEELPKDKRALHTDLPDGLCEEMKETLQPGDVVLIKGSRGGGEKPKMQVLVETVQSLAHK